MPKHTKWAVDSVGRPGHQQFGTVLTFKLGVTKAQAEQAIRELESILETPARVQGFNPEHGGPVWYCP